MIEELKKWIIGVARDFIDSLTAGAGELCNETVETAGAICNCILDGLFCKEPCIRSW